MQVSEFDRELNCIAPPDSAALPVWAVRPTDLDSTLAGLSPATASFIAATGFTAAPGQIRLVPGEHGLSGALLGLGVERSLWSHAALSMGLPENTAWRLVPGDYDLEEAVLGFCLGAYQYTALTNPKRKPALLTGLEAHPVAIATARAIWLARDLINTPANLLGPAELAEVTVSLGERFGAETKLTSGAALDAEYPAIAAVGRGSVRAPVVAAFTWQGSGARPDSKLISLCGKGVCFDTGGYDLKPSSAMLRMKKDMGGAALMLGLASAIMRLDLPMHLAVRIGCVENMVSGGAMRPLDVLKTRRGLTVEIGNTDAEGRLVLCDLMAEASDEAPDLMLDAATLTGAARVALGPDLPALFTPDDSLADELALAGIAEADPLWRLPIHEGYGSWLDSSIADINNVSSKPHAGAIVATLFLQRFVAPGIRWAHCDTYAWNDQPRPGRPEGGEAQGLRALLACVRRLIMV